MEVCHSEYQWSQLERPSSRKAPISTFQWGWQGEGEGQGQQWVLPQLTGLQQGVSEGWEHVTNTKCWVFDSCHWKEVPFIFPSSDRGSCQCFGLVYLLPWPRHTDRSRLISNPSVWSPDHHLTAGDCFHFRHLLIGSKRNLAFELNSFSFSPGFKLACYMLKPWLSLRRGITNHTK